MYRNTILEFLSTKHLNLSTQAYFQMTICMLGSKYSDSITKLIKKEDDVNVYHIKEPRIYHKSYNFELLESTIVMMLLELKQEVCFNKEELNFQLQDPYYLDDLRKIDFSSVQATPVIENDELIAVVLTYYNNKDGKVKYTNNELVKLVNNLTKAEENYYEKELITNVITYNKFYLLAKKNQQLYFNDELKKKFGYSSNISTLKDLSISRKVSNFLDLQGIKKIKYEGLDVYYLEIKKNIKNVSNKDILAMYNINNHGLSKDFSYIMIRKSPLEELEYDLTKVLEWLNKIEDIKYKIHEYNDETLIVLINKLISLDEVRYLKETLKDDYIVLLKSPSDVTENMNLIRLSDYLYEVQPEKFTYQEYIDYLNKHNTISLNYGDKVKSGNLIYQLVNVDNNEVLAKFDYLPLRANLRDSHVISYKGIVSKELVKLSKVEESKLFVNIPYSLLIKRKTLEDVKKILANNNSLWINVIYDGDSNYDEFIKNIAKFKKMNLSMCCDSSVYLNFYLMASIDLFDAIYVQNEEYMHIRSHNVGIPQSIFSYALHEHKYLFIENFKPNDELDYIHPNCYFIKQIQN